ncbi:MAG: hypothetical protein MJB14_08025 [Spirochaetes bacterium]|nr:hypothetical protein [Spirochaetota bacterium]
MKRFLIILALLFCTSLFGFAQHTWDNAGTNTEWDDGGNWTGPAGYPQDGDNAVISTRAPTYTCTLDSIEECDDLTINGTGELDLNTNQLTIENLIMSAGDIDLNGGTLIITDGSSNSLTGGTITFNGGTLDASGIDIELDGMTLDFTAGGTLICRDFTLTTGTVTAGTGTFQISRDLTFDGGTFTNSGNSIIEKTGTSRMDFRDSVGVTLDHLETSGTGDIRLYNTINISGDLTFNSTTNFDMENQDQAASIAGDITFSAAGTIEIGDANLTISGSTINFTNGNFNDNGSGIMIFDGTTQTFNPAGETFCDIQINDNVDVTLAAALTCGDLTINNTGTAGTLTTSGNDITSCTILTIAGTLDCSAGGSVTATGNLSIGTSGFFDADNQTITIGGDWDNNRGDAGFDETGTTVVLNGAGGHSLDSSDATQEAFNNLQIENGSYVVDINAGNLVNIGGWLLLDSGATLEFSTNDDGMTVDGDITAQGGGTLVIGDSNFTANGDDINFTGGNFTDSGSGTFVFNRSGTQNLTCASENLCDIQISNGSNLTLQDTFSCASLTIDSGSNLNGNSQILNISGDWTDNDADGFDESVTTVIFNGTGTITTAETFYDVNISSGTRDISGGITLDINDDLTINGGTLTLTPNNNSVDIEDDLTISGGGTLEIGNGDINVGGSTIDFTGGTYTQTGTGDFILDGGASQSVDPDGNSIGDIQITSGSTLDLQSDLDCASITIDGTSALDANGNTIDVAGDWDNQNGSAGSFVQAGSTVAFSGTGTIYNDEDFNNLTITGGTRTVTAGITLAVSGNFVADGSSSAVTLTSSTTSDWFLNVTTSAIAYANPNNVSAYYSDASGGITIASAHAGGTIDVTCTNWDDDGPTITSRETMDDDLDGYIDYIRVTFDENIDDSTFTGNGLTADVSGYTFNSLVTNTPNETGTADDAIIYVQFTESATFDTGDTPDVEFLVDADWWDDLRGTDGNLLFAADEGAGTTPADDANPVIGAVYIEIDDPAGFDSSPHYNEAADSYSAPGGVTYNMYDPGSTANDPTDNTYHNILRIVFSEAVRASTGLASNPGPYVFTGCQSTGTLGDFNTPVANQILVDGLGTIDNCDIQLSSAGNNFMQFADDEQLIIHIAGWYDGSEYPAYISSASVVPTTGDVFITQNNAAITDANGLQLVDRGNVSMTENTAWDIYPPKFRFNNLDPNEVTDIDQGITYGSPLIYRVEFMLTEAVRDLADGTDMTNEFNMTFNDDNSTVTGLEYYTGIQRLGDYMNIYDGVPPYTDGDAHDQGFAISFTSVTGKSEVVQIIWTYSPTDSSKYIFDLRGNRLQAVVTDQLTLEIAPPYISKTMAAPGSNQIYVEFNEGVQNSSGGAIEAADFQLDTGDSISSIVSVNGSSSQYIFYASGTTLTRDVIANNYIQCTNPTNVEDSIGNSMTPGDDHRISDVGINFFSEIAMTDFVNQGANWEVTKLDGSKKINLEDMRLEVDVNVTNYDTFRPLLYYDVLDSDSDSEYWEPENNSQDRSLAAHALSSGNWEFKISSSDSEFTDDAVLSMVLKVGDLYCYQSKEDVDSSSFKPQDIEAYQIQLNTTDFTESSVLIFNNVINPNQNEEVTLTYHLEKSGPVSIMVYDLTSRLVCILKTEPVAAGVHTVSWDGRNNNGKIVSRGVYFIRVRAPGISNQIRKVLVIK